MTSRKITVKHYLNKRAKAKIFNGESYYPLYIQLIVTARKAQIKSRINEHLAIYQTEIEKITRKNKELADLMFAGYFSGEQIETILKKETFPLFQLLNDEVDVITRIIALQKPFNNNSYSLKDFAADYERYITEITDVFDRSIKRDYKANLNRIFHNTVDKSLERKAFNISNYFIHYLNWNFTFSNFYEVTYEVITSELKFLENYLSKELLTAIKAYLAYHSKVNILKRYLEKKEHGKISTLSYLDWITEIKDFISREFIKIFGKKKAQEYIDSLDTILTRNITG